MLTFNNLVQVQKKGFRNGSWRKLSILDRSFFRASICYAKLKGMIVSRKLLAELGSIIRELTSTLGMSIFRSGLLTARSMLAIFEEERVFNWASEVKDWLEDPNFIFWLGLNQWESECCK